MNIIVIGYGRVGASLANMLASMEHAEVTIVDSDPAVVSRIITSFPGRVIQGVGFDEATLREAGIESCDVGAAVTSSDNVNVMASEVARRLFNVPRVITRLVNPARLDVYQQLGFDYICDTERVAEDIFAKIISRQSNHLDTMGSYEILEFTYSSRRTAKPQIVAELESRADVTIELISRDEETFRPSPNSVLEDGDQLLCVVHVDDLERISDFMKG